jgi:hypothetical protein
MRAVDKISKQLIDSLVWIRDHPGEQYKHANHCEQSFAEGLAFAIGQITGSDHTPRQIIEEFRDELPAPKPKKSLKRTPPKKTLKRRTLKR